jgi:hypothetical protein
VRRHPEYQYFPAHDPDHDPAQVGQRRHVTAAEGLRGIPAPPPPTGAARGGAVVVGDGAEAEAAGADEEAAGADVDSVGTSLVMTPVFFHSPICFSGSLTLF